MTIDIKNYLVRFEKEVIAEGFLNSHFKREKKETIPLNGGRVAKTDFGIYLFKMGKAVDTTELITINYYGLFKPSVGILKLVEDGKLLFSTIRSFNSIVIHFSSIRPKDIKKLSPSLFRDFAEFKLVLASKRWGL
jgi:hypothetical protein